MLLSLYTKNIAIIANIIISMNGNESCIINTYDDFKLLIEIYQFIYVYSFNVQSLWENKLMKPSEIMLMGQYIKDLSFENPLAPNLPTQKINPTVNLDINTTYQDLKKDHHEINLKIKSTATIDKDTLFIIELQYAGLIKTILKGEDDKKNLIIFGSKLLFPFARSIITNITMEGGFKPLIIQPVEFDNIFQK